MKTTRMRRYALAPLLIALVAASLALTLGAAQARASDGGMSGMQGMSAEEMQNMVTPTPAPSVTAVAGDMAPAMDPHMDMGGGGSANWFVVGGFVVLIAGATLAAVATKRHLRRRMLAGELAGEGVQDV
jgi:hypothetical protein